MAKKEESMPVEGSVVPVEVAEIVLPIPAAPVKRFTFEQWASQRPVKAHHKSGLKAFCGNPDKLRTMEDWDKVFEGY